MLLFTEKFWFCFQFLCFCASVQVCHHACGWVRASACVCVCVKGIIFSIDEYLLHGNGFIKKGKYIGKLTGNIKRAQRRKILITQELKVKWNYSVGKEFEGINVPKTYFGLSVKKHWNYRRELIFVQLSWDPYLEEKNR